MRLAPRSYTTSNIKREDGLSPSSTSDKRQEEITVSITSIIFTAWHPNFAFTYTRTATNPRTDSAGSGCGSGSPTRCVDCYVTDSKVTIEATSGYTQGRRGLLHV